MFTFSTVITFYSILKLIYKPMRVTMGRLVKRAGLFGAAIVILGACDTFSGGELSLKNKVVSAEGVRSMVHGKEFVKKGSTEFNEVNVDEIIVDVLGSGKSVKDVSSIKDWNLIQDMLFAASNQRCNLYRRFIQRVGTQTNFLLGALSTLAGGAGVIVTGADTARALAGVSGAASGLRGEFNETYFRSVATQVIVKGIDTRRETLKQQIIEARDADTSSPPAKYTAAMAIADAIAYHGQCTIMAGLEEANDSLASPEDVGMDRFLKSFKKYEELRKAFEASEKDEDANSNDNTPNSNGPASDERASGNESPGGQPGAGNREVVTQPLPSR